MASTVSRSVVLALEVLDAEALHRVSAIHASERFEMCLCAQIAKGVVPTFPCVVLPLPATRPNALAFSLVVAQYLLDSPADDVIFYGPVCQLLPAPIAGGRLGQLRDRYRHNGYKCATYFLRRASIVSLHSGEKAIFPVSGAV